MSKQNTVFASRIAEATLAVFGDSGLTRSVSDACTRYENDLENIQTGRGINALLIAIVGAKGQGKTWTARQFVRDSKIQTLLRSGDLIDDATTRLVWIGPVAPDGLDPASEIYHPCQVSELAQIGQPYVVLDTPGLTDANQRAATLAEEALSLAPIKILVVARDQLRAAANMEIAKQIDGSICVLVVSSVEPDEMPGNKDASGLAEDLRTLRDQLVLMAPKTQLQREILVPDFEITGDEKASSQVFLGQFLDQISELGLTELALESARDHRVSAAGRSRRRNRFMGGFSLRNRIIWKEFASNCVYGRAGRLLPAASCLGKLPVRPRFFIRINYVPHNAPQSRTLFCHAQHGPRWRPDGGASLYPGPPGVGARSHDPL